MDADRWQHASRLFDGALDIEPDRRMAWLDEACAGDVALKDLLKRWLAVDASDETFLDTPALAMRAFVDGDLDEDGMTDLAGTCFGDYRALQRIGSGGMGEVWLAECVDGEFEQRVAIKRLLHPTPELVARFRRERNVLAGLQHPNIAQLFGGGVGVDGAPYIVMELVSGVPLTDYCVAVGPDLETRIELFVQVCAAVDHAHRNLVVHRDLKPSNILVTADGRAKLLDFGIAKLLDATLGDGDALTRVQRLTPEYAAPEQLAGAPITTATDVYALGILLCEVLTGKRPFPNAGTDVGRAAREPIAPSALATIRAGDAPVPPRRLRGDLDRIVLRALAAEAERRYASVAAMAEDLRCHLQGLPIVAGGDGAWYRTSKFVRRHRVAGIAIASVVLSLVIGSALALWQAGKATAQARFAASQQALARDRATTAEGVTRFMVGLFEASDPAVAQGEMPRADDLLAAGSARIATELRDQPMVQAELYDAMAMSYMGLNRFDQAARLLDEASTAIRPLVSAHAAQLRARIALHRGSANAELGHYRTALGALDEAAAALAGSDDPPADDLAHVATVRAWIERDMGQLRRSETDLRAALLALAPDGRLDEGAARVLNNLAYTLELLGEEGPSIAAYEQVVAWRERNDKPGNPARLWAAYTFARGLRTFGHTERAHGILDVIQPTMRKVLGNEHSDVAGADIVLGQVRMDSGDVEGGHALIVDAVARSHRVTRRNALWANAEMALAEADFRVDQLVSARAHYLAARSVWSGLVGEDHPDVRVCDGYLAAIDMKLGIDADGVALDKLDSVVALQRARSEVGLRSSLALLAEARGAPAR